MKTAACAESRRAREADSRNQLTAEPSSAVHHRGHGPQVDLDIRIHLLCIDLAAAKRPATRAKPRRPV